MVFTVLLDSEKHSENIRAGINTSVASMVAVSSELNFKDFKYAGRVYTADTLGLLVQDDPALAGAIATMFLYCPIPREGLASTAASAFLMALYLSRKLYHGFRLYLKSWFWAFRVSFVLIWLAFTASPRTLGYISDWITLCLSLFVYPFYFLFRRGGWRSARKFVRLVTLIMAVRLLNLAFRLQILSGRGVGNVKGFTPKKESLRSFWNNTIMDLTRLVDNISLPNFIRSLPDRFDVQAINETNDILASLGWPKAEVVTEQPNAGPANFQLYASHFIGNAGMEQGIHRLELTVASELSNLAGLAPEYKRSEQFATVENELESLARYFSGPQINIPDLPIDDIWVIVGDIFANSKLTPFNYILKKWEKAYGLSPFYRDPDSRRWRKLSRRKFIASIGGMANMVKLWAKTFEVAPGLIPVAGVSVKGEALPEKKWRNDLVRTIVSSPLVHYISSTMWNYQPNHNFKFWSTNIKVGMPLNGANLSRLVAEHASYHHHFAGDFKAFDSTIVAKVGQIVGKVRKKGFERHRDYAKICFLIDANYSTLQKAPLLTTSTGNIYEKVQGLSTGHSSTSMDNSLAVTIYYLCAWRQLTGLSAHEFRHYCKLSNYGDDHLLSWLGSAPASWTGSNIQKSMARFGVELKDEEPSRDLLKMQFLSKGWRLPSSVDRAEMEDAGLTLPTFVVYHDPIKLVGKAYAPSKDIKVDRNYRIKRLVSYLYLTAHHKDLYEKIEFDIQLLRKTKKGGLLPMPVPLPSYSEVLTRWYDPKSVVPEEDTDQETGEIIDYSMDGLVDTVVNILSVIPDVVNPAIYNMGYTTYLTSLFAKYVSWPVELVRRSNSAITQVHLVNTLKKTCYDFLADNPVVTNTVYTDTDGGLLLKHWLYLGLRGPDMTPKAFRAGAWIDKKLGDFNFVLNGYVQTITRRLELPVFQILMIAGLSFVPSVNLPKFINYIRLPTISAIVEGAFGIILNKFWASVPPNMKQANAALSQLGPEQPVVLVEAPTGTGKSTTFANFAYRYHSHRFARYILVVPRQLLVLTLAPYLRTAYGLPAREVTEGYPYDSAMRFIVCTPGEVLLHEEWHTEGNVFQIDECHVSEPMMIGLMSVLSKIHACMILTTATPSPANIELSSVHVPLQIAQSWRVIDTGWERIRLDPTSTYNDYWSDYRGRCISLARSQLLSRILIFVVDVSHARSLAAAIGRRCCILSSEHKYVDQKAEVFIATSVADVGLTIPNVDWVITSNLIRKQVRENKVSTVRLVEINSAIARQRRGRTGRTNNGLFTMFEYKSAPFVHEDPAWSDLSVGISMLQSGVPPAVIGKYFPGVVTSLWGEEYSRDMDPVVDAFVEQMSRFGRALEQSNQRTFKAAEDGVNYGDLWTIQGNTLPMSQIDPNDPTQATKVTADVMFDFVVGAVKWMSDLGREISEEDIITYFRSDRLSAASFKQRWKGNKFKAMANLKDHPASIHGEPSGRFSQRGVPINSKDLPDVNEGFEHFHNT
jgi:hypothetical protein